jgi:hypothetical protein
MSRGVIIFAPSSNVLILMANFISWLKALRLYFASRKTRYWYRESTNEWVYEIDTIVTGYYLGNSRYPHRYKFLCWFVWLVYFNSVVEDLRKDVIEEK